jgi:hypothetical protein
MIAENEAEEYQHAEQKKQVYLTRVNQLFGNIKNWLKDEPVAVKLQELEIIEKFTGHYIVPSLSISTQTGQELAEIKPKGAYIILAEGLVDIEGGFGREHITYMVDGGPYNYRPLPEHTTQFIKKPMFNDIDDNGWYWIEETTDEKVHFINNKNALLDVITQVSDYEF